MHCHIYSGYVQGMSDLLSPILVVMENEMDAFWCFAGFMERVVGSAMKFCSYCICISVIVQV